MYWNISWEIKDTVPTGQPDNKLKISQTYSNLPRRAEVQVSWVTVHIFPIVISIGSSQEEMKGVASPAVLPNNKLSTIGIFREEKREQVSQVADHISHRQLNMISLHLRA